MLQCLASMVLLGASAFFPVLAQTKQKDKAAPTKQAKVKILKEEDGEFLLLDTTLTVKEGKSLQEVVKKLEESGTSFKQLGAKKIKPARIRHGENLSPTRIFSLHAGDSLKAVQFRSAVPVSVFRRLKGVKVYGIETMDAGRVRDLESKVIYLSGDSVRLRSHIILDSLVRGRTFFRVDSLLHTRPDTFLLRQRIQVEKDETGDLKIFRLKNSDSKFILEEGEYEATRFTDEGTARFIILKPAKAPLSKKEARANRRKAEAKASNLEVTYFPNPTSGKVNLAFNVPKKTKAQVRVVNGQGKTVYQEDLGTIQGNYSKALDLTKFGKGVYVVQLQIGNTAQSSKVVVQ